MKKDLTELVFVLDMSGSMNALTEDTIGGFNSLIKEQRENPGEALVSTVLFNTTSRVIHDRVPIAEVRDMTTADYRASGGTALLDALGRAIHHISNVHRYIREEDVPEKTVVVVTTDGMENSSREYTFKKVKEMVDYKKEKGWEFIFLGANIDSYDTGASLGFEKDCISNYMPDREGTSRAFSAVNSAVSYCRFPRDMEPRKRRMDPSWKEEVSRDYEERRSK